MSMFVQIDEEVRREGNAEKAAILARFFKTGKGEYGEGDIFLGLTVPQSRKIVRKYRDVDIQTVEELLQSQIHEERLIALLIMVLQFERGDKEAQKKIYDFYLAHTKYINNWDLVDLSAGHIVGRFLAQGDRSVLFRLADSRNLWEKRIAVLSTFAFIKDLGESKDTFAIADILLEDRHDLIQKAVGWMLREVGKRVSEEVLETFLRTRYKRMPRTMLRYAIERFDEEKRKKYMIKSSNANGRF